MARKSVSRRVVKPLTNIAPRRQNHPGFILWYRCQSFRRQATLLLNPYRLSRRRYVWPSGAGIVMVHVVPAIIMHGLHLCPCGEGCFGRDEKCENCDKAIHLVIPQDADRKEFSPRLLPR